jgi:hypothetical protein
MYCLRLNCLVFLPLRTGGYSVANFGRLALVKSLARFSMACSSTGSVAGVGQVQQKKKPPPLCRVRWLQKSRGIAIDGLKPYRKRAFRHDFHKLDNIAVRDASVDRAHIHTEFLGRRRLGKKCHAVLFKSFDLGIDVLYFQT